MSFPALGLFANSRQLFVDVSAALAKNFRYLDWPKA